MPHKQIICETCQKSMRSDHLKRHEMRHRDIEISNVSDVSMHALSSVINQPNDRSSMKVIPYMIPSKCRREDDFMMTPTEKVKVKSPLAPQRKFGNQSRVSLEASKPIRLEYSDGDDKDEIKKVAEPISYII